MSRIERTVTAPEKFVFDDRVDRLNVRIVGGAVNVVGTDADSARVEVTEIGGPPLKIELHDGALTVGYDDVPWKGLLKWLDRKGWERHAVISLAVPQTTRVEVGVVGAAAVVSGVSGPTTVQGVNGDTTLVGLTGEVKASTVAGNVEAQALSGDLRFSTVSGDLTVVEGSGGRVKADSVSGNMVLDLDPAAGADVRLTTVSGEIAIRIPEPGDADVDANTTSGHVSCAFDELRVTGQWGAKRITGRIGDGSARLRATTVSGSLAVLRRPPLDDAASDAGSDAGPGSGRDSGPDSGPGDGTGDRTDPADGTGPAGGPAAGSSDGGSPSLRKDV